MKKNKVFESLGLPDVDFSKINGEPSAVEKLKASKAGTIDEQDRDGCPQLSTPEKSSGLRKIIVVRGKKDTGKTTAIWRVFLDVLRGCYQGLTNPYLVWFAIVGSVEKNPCHDFAAAVDVDTALGKRVRMGFFSMGDLVSAISKRRKNTPITINEDLVLRAHCEVIVCAATEDRFYDKLRATFSGQWEIKDQKFSSKPSPKGCLTEEYRDFFNEQIEQVFTQSAKGE